MSLLLLFAYTNVAPSVPISELVETAPLSGVGYAIQRPATSGEWRFGLELADPTAGDAIVWHDITRFYAGDSYQRGADEYLGRYRAAVAQVQLQTDNDDLAPWGQDTSDLFGVNVNLDAGLLMRATMFRVDASVTVEWEPLWTGRVETWGDASAARGQIRTHVVTVTDTIADLANVPTVIDVGGGLSFSDFLTSKAGWLFGVDSYGDTDVVIPFDLSSVNAINRMDQGADPFGYVWRSRRDGRLITYPAPWDTTNVDRWPNPLLDVYPSGLVFSFSPDFTDIEYIADDDAQQFGIQRTSLGVLNSFIVTTPSLLFSDDDPVSQARYGVRPYVTSWVAEGVEQVVLDLLAARAYSSSQALPLRTTLDHEGFWSAMALIDHLDPVTIIHATTDDGLVVTAPGTVRNVTEDRTVRGEGDDGVMLLSWQSTVQVDITATDTSPALLPVEDLHVVQSNSPLFGGPSSAEFAWTNPTQPDITPTEVQYRMIGVSLIWNPKTYPGVGSDGTTIGFLSAATTYTMQVRLVRRVAGVITAFSASRQVTFTTPAIIYPTPVPDGDSTNVTVGEPPDFTDDCVLEVELQANDGTGWVTVDSFTQSDLVQNADGTWSLIYPIDNSFFDTATLYRFRSREVCGGIDGQWFTGTTFDPPDDWTDPCTDPPALSDPPYNDPSLIVYVPKVCGPDTIEEAVSGIAGVHGPAFDGFVQMLAQPDRLALLAVADPAWSAAPFGILAYGECPQINGVTGDKSIGVFTAIVNNDACVLFECAGMQITAAPGSGSNWSAGVTVTTVDGVLSLISADIPVGADGVNIMATFEAATGDVVLSVDGVEADSGTFGAATTTVAVLPIWRVGAPPESWVTDCALFDSVVASIPNPDDIPDLEAWWDAADAGTLTLVVDKVSAWADKSGNGHNVSQGTGASRPTSGSRTQNGLNVLDFDGTNDFLSVTQFLFDLGAQTTFIVYEVDAMSSGGTTAGFCGVITERFSSNDTRKYGLLFTASNSQAKLQHETTGTDYVINGANVVANGAHLVAWTDSTTTANLYVDGNSPVSSGGYTRSSSSFNEFDIGTFQPKGAWLDGWIAEIIVYARVLTSDEIIGIQTYLTNKWGL